MYVHRGKRIRSRALVVVGPPPPLKYRILQRILYFRVCRECGSVCQMISSTVGEGDIFKESLYSYIVDLRWP